MLIILLNKKELFVKPFSKSESPRLESQKSQSSSPVQYFQENGLSEAFSGLSVENDVKTRNLGPIAPPKMKKNKQKNNGNGALSRFRATYKGPSGSGW